MSEFHEFNCNGFGDMWWTVRCTYFSCRPIEFGLVIMHYAAVDVSTYCVDRITSMHSVSHTDGVVMPKQRSCTRTAGRPSQNRSHVFERIECFRNIMSIKKKSICVVF